MRVDTGVGATLREARKRREVDLSEVEAGTKIRIRYLRAIENEEWDALPGSAYTRGFIRAYASYLGLDGERLAEEYRHESGSPRVEKPERVEPAATGARGRRTPRLAGAGTAAVVAALIGALVAIGVLSGGESETGGSDRGASRPGAAPATGEGGESTGGGAAPAPAPGVTVQLSAEGEVWVCLLDVDGVPLVEGRILEAGAEEGPFRSEGFAVAFGNGEVSMLVDGEPAGIPVSSDPIGYEIDSEGELAPLAEGERPTCT